MNKIKNLELKSNNLDDTVRLHMQTANEIILIISFWKNNILKNIKKQYRYIY